jgi:regulator of replication initiation timing
MSWQTTPTITGGGVMSIYDLTQDNNRLRAENKTLLTENERLREQLKETENRLHIRREASKANTRIIARLRNERDRLRKVVEGFRDCPAGTTIVEIRLQASSALDGWEEKNG